MEFTVSYSVIPNSDIDPDSPLATGLFQDLRDNTTFCLEYIGGGTGGGFTPAAAHNHNGTNSAKIPQLIDSGYGESSSGSIIGGTVTAISISSVSVASGQRILIWGNSGVSAPTPIGVTIKHNGSTVTSRTLNVSTPDLSIIANSDTVRSGTLELILTCDPFGAGTYSSAQLMYQIIQE